MLRKTFHVARCRECDRAKRVTNPAAAAGVGRLAQRPAAFQTIARLLLILSFASWPPVLRAQNGERDLSEMAIERLADIEVTSVAKKQQSLFRSASAVFVITREDIRRSGAASIPELLRMVPGLSVARLNGNMWAISARGFNSRYADKMLVLVDGRSVYTSLFSGVYWDVQDTMIEDIERIEVIRGPGATLWGANAVNGVINIITRHSQETLGGIVTAGAGSEERFGGGVRYGARLGSEAAYRIYGKYFNRDNPLDAGEESAGDSWDIVRGGFRADWKVKPADSLTFQGDIYNGDVGRKLKNSSLVPPFQRTTLEREQVSGANLLARWSHVLAGGSELDVQTYYDQADRRIPTFGEHQRTFDLDLQHHLAVGRRQDLIWGVGYRVAAEQTRMGLTVSFTPPQRTDQLGAAFVQDEVSLVPDRLSLTLGSKFEHNSYTGFEVQPSGRLMWTPNSRHAAWAAVSRAVRTPSLLDRGIRVNAAAFPGPRGVPSLLGIFGNPDFSSQSLLAYEAGYRARRSKRLSLDLATFFNRYHDLTSHEPGVPFFESVPAPLHMVIPIRLGNGVGGKTYGAELVANWTATSRWSLSAGYSHLQMKLRREGASRDPNPQEAEGDSPKHQVHFRSHYKLNRTLELDTALNYVSRLSNQGVPAYTRLDVRFGWHPLEALEFSFGGQNLLDARHLEFSGSSQGLVASQIHRSAYAKATWRF